MLEQNTQVGFGITQITPADENIPQELRQFSEMNPNPNPNPEENTGTTVEGFRIEKCVENFGHKFVENFGLFRKAVHSFYNTVRLGSSDTIMPATIINC